MCVFKHKKITIFYHIMRGSTKYTVNAWVRQWNINAVKLKKKNLIPNEEKH